jgi:hypothetical protein
MEGNIHVISDLSLYNFAVNRINHLVITRYLYNPDFYDKNTLLVEFSRGGEIGYKDTLKLFDPSVLKKGAIIYIKASFEEAWRRNVARYEEKRKFSILAHMVPREQMERLYGQDDWDLITKGEENGFIEISGVKIPFVTMDNEKEAKDPKIMMERYRNALDKLISSYLESRKEKSSNARSHFHNLFVFGRPAGGKSEFIEFFKTCEPGKRRAKFKIAPFSIIDDYLSLREISENEEILEASNLPRKVTETTSDGIVVKDSTFFHFASEKINRIFDRDYGKKPDYYNNNTLLLEFSRGDGDSGYKRSLSGIKKEILKDAAIIYIDVSYEEALRRNEARYQEKLKHSVLAHKVPEKAMEKYYKNDDWKTLTLGKTNGFVEINGVKIPFVTMNNEPESKDPEILENRYETALKRVFDLWTNNG